MSNSHILTSLRSRFCHTPAHPLLVFGLSVAFGAGPAHAGEPGALPQDPNVAAGTASFSQSGRTLTVNQTSNRTIIDWRSFDIGADAQTNFHQPDASSIAVNRVNAGTDPTKIDGGLSANGQVWILNPNGVLFGKNAQVDVAGIIASTANIDAKHFMSGDSRLTFTGKSGGMVANDGHISVSESGLAAFVAPAVRNTGMIVARMGKISLAAGTTFTLDLAGDHLLEIGLGADQAMVDQTGQIVAPGGTVQLSARTASNVVDGAINMSGVIRTASAHQAGGDVILDGDMVAISGVADTSGTEGGTISITGRTINVTDSAVLRADAQGGKGGTIAAIASLRGNYGGHYSARATAGDGGTIETSGETVVTAPDIAVDASSTGGKAGQWLIDPLDVTIAPGSGGGMTGATVTVGAIQTALAAGTEVTITTDQTGSGAGDLTLTASINATSTNNAGLTLTGRHLQTTGNSVINIGGGALTLNVNSVNANSAPPTGGWINDALGMVGTVSGGTTINLGPGIYTTSAGYINVNKSNLIIRGAGQGLTILDSRGASTYGLRVTALNNVSLSGFTLYGATGPNAYGLKAEATTNLSLSDITSQGAAKSEFDLNGIIGGTLNGLVANGAAAIGPTFTSGAATAGNGISLTDSQNIALSGSTTLNNQWGGLALYQSNFSSGYTFQERNITVAASNNFTETNAIYAEDQSATNNFGNLTLAGYDYVVQAPGSADNVYSWFQKTQQAAIDYAVNAGVNSTVQGYAGNGQSGNNIFSVGYGSLNGGGTRALSISAAINAASSGATINILGGIYILPTQININKSLSLIGGGIAATTLTSNSTGYGINITADNARLSGFTFNAPTASGTATYGIKVTPDTGVASDRLLNFSIDHVKINGGYRSGLDLNGVLGANIDNVSVSNVVNGNGIALTDSANVTITNTVTSNNAWGGLALYQTNHYYNQQINNILVDASNSFNEVIPVYAEDQSTSLDIGSLALAGFGYVVKAPNVANDVYTWFQKTSRAAIDFVTNATLSNNTLVPQTATVQGYSGSGINGNNAFVVGIGSNGIAMSLASTLNTAAPGATVNISDGTYIVPGGSFLGLTKNISMTGQSEAGTIIDATAANTYGLRVQADNVTLSNFTLKGPIATGGYGIKVEPLSSTSGARINNISISHLTVTGSNKSGLDINGGHNIAIDHVTAKNAAAGNGIAIIDSTDVTITGSVTSNNAWGGLRIEEKNTTYNQQTDRITVDTTNSFGEATPVYLEDDSPTQNFGTVTVQGFNFAVRAPNNPADLYTWLQKTQQGAIDYAANLNLASATVQGWTGTTDDNHFVVGTGSLAGGSTRTLSIQSALNVAQTGAIIDVASGRYEESLVQNTQTTMNFGTVTLGGSYTLNSAAANSTLSGALSATAVNWAAGINLGGALLLNTSTTNGKITTAAINGGQALTVNAGVGAISLGALGATTRLGAVTLLGDTTLTGGTYNAASFDSGDLTLAADTSINTIGTLEIAAINGNRALTVSGSAATLGSLGTTAHLGAVNNLSRTTLTGDTYNAASLTFANDVTLTKSQTTLDTSATGGGITINGTLLGSTDGAQSVKLSTGVGTGSAALNGDIVLQNVGTSSVSLGSMAVAGGNFDAQTVHLAGDFISTLVGNQIFSSHTLNARGHVQAAVGGNASGPINAGGSVGLSVSGELSGAIGGSDISLNAGIIQGATVTATQGVTINADTVAGSILSGQTVIATAVNFNTDINAGSITLSAAAITGSTITGSQDISITAKSVLGSNLAAPTVTASATTFNSTIKASSGAKITAVDIAGNFTGGSFTLAGSNSVNANIAANSATVSGNTITGTYTGNSIALAGGASVNATVTSNTLSVQAPSGNLQGHWDNVNTGASGTLVLNHQASIGDGNVGPSQLVVENFVLPKGTAITTRGNVVMPQNQNPGLLSPPSSDTPSFVVVQSVQQLGALLAQNYSAIVIDLSGSPHKDETIN